LTNHQIAAETRAILSRYSLLFCLDVMIVQESYFWPTWVVLPIPSTNVNELKVNFRVFGTAISARKHLGMFMSIPSHNGNPPRFANEFYSLLERILKRGPFFPSLKSLALLTKTAGFQQYFGAEKTEESLSRIQSILLTGDEINLYDKDMLSKILNARKILAGEFTDQKIVINTLILDCKTPSTWQGQRTARPEVGFAQWKTEAYYTSESSSNTVRTPTSVPVIRPEWLASYLVSEFTSLLQLRYSHEWCAGIFYERIGRIQINIDGSLVTTLELGSMLARLDVTDQSHFLQFLQGTEGYWSIESQTLEFLAWKDRTLRSRKGNGLPVDA
jgi:hypothetical protein